MPAPLAPSGNGSLGRLEFLDPPTVARKESRSPASMAISRRDFLRGGLATVGGLYCCVGDEIDRKASDQGPFDVCVIGSGFAGTHLALRAAGRGLTTVIVEAGSRFGGSGNADLQAAFQYDNSGEVAYPVNATRRIGVGGTSGIWTGRVNRLRPTDFRVRSEFGMSVDWPIGHDELEPYFCQAERELSATGYDPVPGAEPPRSCDYPFAKAGSYRPPVASFEGEALKFFSVPQSKAGGTGGPVRLAQAEIPRFLELPGANLLADRQVTEIVTLDGRTIDHVVVRTAGGSESRLRAESYVVAAGAVEIPRLLLRSGSRWFPHGLGNNHDLVGRFFVEHPTLMWSFQAKSVADLPRGVHRTYSLNDRFRAEGLNACHFQFVVHRSDKVVWKLQPEMEARGENRVSLSASKRDMFGDPVPDLSLTTSELDRRTVDRGTRLLEHQARHLGAEPSRIREMRKWRAHPAGTCRMAHEETGGVVDENLKVFGLDNLFLSGSAVFPTSGTSNPTLTVVALTLRLADHLLAKAGV